MDLNIFKNRALQKENILTVGGYTFTKADLIGGVNYEQTVNAGQDIILGSCTCSTIEFKLNNLNQLINNLAGQEITWTIRVETSAGIFEDVPMGIFIAEKPTKNNEISMTIKAYDRMTKFDKIVDSWLNTVSYPITLKNYLLGLCGYVGVTLATTTFLNEAFPIQRNFIGKNVTGRQVLKWIVEVTAKYAVINELGQLKLGWYTPIVYGITNANYYNIKVEDYTVKKIDKLQVQVVENDIGVIVGTGTNVYIIQGNPLLFADTDAEIRPYVENIYNAIKDFTYTPYEIAVNFNPMIKSGNTFTITTRKGQVINAVIMARNMSGWNDVYNATGNANRAVNTSLNQTIQQIRGKTNTLERTIEKTVSQLYDADTGDLTLLTQTVNSFNTRVQTIESNLNFKFQQDTAPLNPAIGDVWFSTSNEVFIVNNLLMTVDEMIQQVDYYSASLNKSYRWDGANWQHIEDGSITELRINISEIDQTVNNISLSVSTYDGRIGSLELTANSLTSRLSTAEGNISEVVQTASTLTSRILNTEGDINTLEQTATSLTSRITSAEGNISTLTQTSTSLTSRISTAEGNISTITQNVNSITSRISTAEGNISTVTQTASSLTSRISGAEGNISTIQQTTSGITLAVNAAKVLFDANGLTIDNGGFYIKSGSTTLLNSEGGNLYLRGEVRTGYATLNSNGLYLQPYQSWDGTPSGGRVYFDNSNNRLIVEALGWSVLIRTSTLSYGIGNANHNFYGGSLDIIAGDLMVRGQKYIKKRLSEVKTYDYVLSLAD